MSAWLATALLACSGTTPSDDTAPVGDDTGSADTADTDTEPQSDTADTSPPDPNCTDGIAASIGGSSVGGSVDLGTGPLGAGMLSTELTLTNTCDVRLRFLGHPDDWLQGSGFSLDTLPPVFLEPGAQATLVLAHDAGTEGIATGHFELPHDQPGSPFAVDLGATVQAPLTIVWAGDGRHILTTPDYGATFPVDTWETLVAHGDELQRGICAGNGWFVSVGGNVDSRWWRSPDGIDWTAHSDPSGPVFASCAFGDGLFVAATPQAPWTSTDGTTWTQGTGDYEGVHLRGMTFADGTFVAVGDEGKITVTTDGQSWQHEHLLGGPGLRSAAGHDGTFVAVGDAGIVHTSTDSGVTWTTQTLASSGSVVWAGDRFVTGSNPVSSSPDGLVWSAVNDGPGSPSIAVGHQIFTSSGGAVNVSHDGGFSWTHLYDTLGGLGLGSAAAGVPQ